MAERTDIPTEEEMDQMKLSKLTRLLQKLGMTEDETDEMEKEEARAELRKRIRAIQATAATRRRPGQAAEKMKGIVKMHKLKRTRLTVLCRNIFDYHHKLDKRTMKMVKTQMEREAGDILNGVTSQLSKDECPILVAGETSSGKSTFLNLLLGEGDILPVAHMSSTSTICELKYGENREAVVHMREQGHKITIPLDGTEERQAELKSYMHLEGASRDSLPPAEKIEVFWPLPLLEGGIVIVDSPGVGESDVMDKVVAEYIPKCFAFLYIIDSSRAGGVQADRLGKLLKHYTETKHADEDFNLESAMFICNKWDTVPTKEQGKLKEDTYRKLSGMWKGLKKSQVFYVSTREAVGMGGILSEDFTKVLDGIDELLPKSLENKLATQHRLLARLLNTALDHVDGQISVARQNLDKEEKQKRFQKAQKNLQSFRQEADENVEEMESLASRNVRDRNDFLYSLARDKKLEKGIHMRKLTLRLQYLRDMFPEGKKLQDILDMFIEERRSSYSSESIELSALYRVLTANLADVSSFCDHVTTMEKWFLQKMKAVAESVGDAYQTAMSDSMGTSRQTTHMKVNDVLSAKLADKSESILESIAMGVLSGLVSLTLFLTVSSASKEMVDFVIQSILSDELRKGLTHKQLASQQSLFDHLASDVTKMKKVMEQTIEDAFQDTRSNEELLQIYEPQSRDINGLLGHLTMFFLTEVQKYQYSLDSIGGWTDKRNRLGGRSLGKVYRVPLRTAHHTHAALKTGDLITPETACDFMTEQSTLRKLEGVHIVEYYGTACRREVGGLRLGLVMELCDGTLEDRIIGNRDHNPAWWGSNQKKQAAAFSYTQNLAVQLCKGIKHIHDAGYIHRDLKLTSILVTKDSRVKLAVGLTEREVKITGTMVGNPIYAAPEMKEQKAYNKSADIYSLGLILWEMWYGRTLYDEEEDEKYYKSMEEDLKRGWNIRMPRWEGTVPPIPEWTRLINDCLKKDPTRRPQIQDCLDRISAMKIK